jgi:hypothetical protein
MTAQLPGFFRRCYGVKARSGAIWLICDSGERAVELARRVDGRPVSGLHIRVWLPPWFGGFRRVNGSD